MPNNKHKKRIYSKNKTPTFVTDTPILNSFDALCKIKKYEDNVWQRYINFIAMNDNARGGFKCVLEEIPDIYKKKSILLELMNIQDFNPFSPDYALIKNDGTRNLLLKKKRYVEEYHDYCKLVGFLFGDGIICHTSHNDKKDDYDLKMIFNSHSKRIVFKNGVKSLFDVDDLLEELNKQDNNVWKANNSKSFLFVENGKKSKLTLKEFVNIVRIYEKIL